VLPFTMIYINTTCYIITFGCSFTSMDIDSKTFFFCKFFVKGFNTIKGAILHSDIWLGFQLTITKTYIWLGFQLKINHQNLQVLNLALIILNYSGDHITLHILFII